jgi:hypothetical protein
MPAPPWSRTLNTEAFHPSFPVDPIPGGAERSLGAKNGPSRSGCCSARPCAVPALLLALVGCEAVSKHRIGDLSSIWEAAENRDIAERTRGFPCSGRGLTATSAVYTRCGQLYKRWVCTPAIHRHAVVSARTGAARRSSPGGGVSTGLAGGHLSLRRLLEAANDVEAPARRQWCLAHDLGVVLDGVRGDDEGLGYLGTGEATGEACSVTQPSLPGTVTSTLTRCPRG